MKATCLAVFLSLAGSLSAVAQDTVNPNAPGTVQSELQAQSPAEPQVPSSQAPSATSEVVTPQPVGIAPAPSADVTPAQAVQAPVGIDPATPEIVAAPATLPHDLSPWGMFMAADWVVKAVMLGLASASLITWTVWVAKSIEIACAKARANRALKAIMSAENLRDASDALSGRGGPGAFMVRAAAEEVRLSADALDHAGDGGVKERVSSRLSRIEAQAGRRLTKGTGVLATIGSTAPFVGLFGTVWGIMNSFIGISEAQTTNLAVVAPGIAEALLATAIGLVAAIPAVVIYNVFARSITGYRQMLADAGAGVERLVSRSLDFRRVPAGRAAVQAVKAAE
ncbi:MAG: tonB-system energizer ExbB [Phyllobacterium sp.]